MAFACKGRGFCPSCLGRRMCATAANLIEDVLPEVALRQWVLTFPFPWRRRLAQDGELLGALTRIFVTSVEKLYAARAPKRAAGSFLDEPLQRLRRSQGVRLPLQSLGRAAEALKAWREVIAPTM